MPNDPPIGDPLERPTRRYVEGFALAQAKGGFSSNTTPFACPPQGAEHPVPGYEADAYQYIDTDFYAFTGNPGEVSLLVPGFYLITFAGVTDPMVPAGIRAFLDIVIPNWSDWRFRADFGTASNEDWTSTTGFARFDPGSSFTPTMWHNAPYDITLWGAVWARWLGT